MEASKMTSQQDGSVPSRTLLVDWMWTKFHAIISEKDDPQAKPIYDVNYNLLKPHLVFHSAADNSILGTGTIHAISINADCEVRGQPTKLKALKRFKTQYTHLSHAFSKTDEPVPMTWTTTWDLKTWNFICLDPQQNAVGKLSANIWALKKIAYIEFLGSEEVISEAARDEIVITAMTLLYCMVLRCNNIGNLFGSIFARPSDFKTITPTNTDETIEMNGDGKGSTKTKVH